MRLETSDLGKKGLYYLCNKNKDTDVTVQLICTLVFANAKITFSRDVTQIMLLIM